MIFPLGGIVVGNEQFLVDLAAVIPLCHIVQPLHNFDVEAPVQEADMPAVVVAEKPPALNISQRIAQFNVIASRKAGVLVVILGFEVGRVAVEKSILLVVMTDEPLKALVFDHGMPQPPVGRPYEGEGLVEVERLAAEGGTLAGVAVANDFEEGYRPVDIGVLAPLG